jgi:hypothetical protein
MIAVRMVRDRSFNNTASRPNSILIFVFLFAWSRQVFVMLLMEAVFVLKDTEVLIVVSEVEEKFIFTDFTI